MKSILKEKLDNIVEKISFKSETTTYFVIFSELDREYKLVFKTITQRKHLFININWYDLITILKHNQNEIDQLIQSLIYYNFEG